MRRSAIARLGVLVALVGGALVATAAPASAHTIAGPKPSNYYSHILSVTPGVPGISVEVVDLGAKLQLTNRTDRDVIVLGYVDEPYLKVGPNGVYENLHSQATYINRTRNGSTVPANVDTSPTAAPEWHKISDGHSVRWHDHRIHWMSPTPPPQVTTDPNSFHRLSVQTVSMVWQPNTTIEVKVALDWVPGPTGWPWLPVVVILFVVGLLAAMLPRWRVVLALLLGALVVVDAAHAITYEVARPGANFSKAMQFLGGSFVSIAVWIVAVFTIVGVLRRRSEALYGVVFVGAMVAVVGGATDLASLWKSEIPNVGPAAMTRAEVAVSLGLGAGLAIGAIVRLIRTSGAARHRVEQGRWISVLVADLSDNELERIARDLDADDVLDAAFRELATRLGPVAATFADRSLVFVVDTDSLDGPAVHGWSLVAATDGVHAERGRAEPVGGELHTRFPVLLRMLAGVVTVADARSRGLADYTGDEDLLAAVAPLVPETASAPALSPVPDDRTSAS